MKISKRALLAMSGIFTMASLGLMFVSASNGVIDLNVDPNNAIQHFESVKIISTGVNDDSYAVINKKGNLVGIETDYNFVLTSDGEDELINKISKTVSGSSILGGIGNKILGGIYNIILGGKENKIEKGSNSSILGGVANVEGNSKALSVIFGGGGNEIMGSYSSIIGGEGNKVTRGYAIAIGNSNEADGYNSVAMGSGSKVSGKNSFLWSDGKDSNELLEHNVFAVKGENGMVVNTNKAHSLAQLTVSGSLVVYDDKKTLECTEDTKGVLRVINGDIYNNYQKCFCSCDGSGRNVLHEGTRCEAICNNGTGLQAECGSVKVNCDTNPYSYTGAGESGACIQGELVRGTGAFLVDTYSDNTEWIHRSCQTTYGQATGCQQQLTGESCPNLRTGYECIRDHEELTGHLIMNPELPKDSATFWKYDPELSGPCTYMCDQYGEWDPIQGKCIFHECLGELPEGAKLNDEVALPMNDTTHYSYDATSTGACLYSCQKEYGYYYGGAVEKCLKCPDGQIYDEDSGICKVACDMSSTAFETITIMDYSGYAITIADRNLGAISNNIGEVSSYGCYFQWGNNYGFQPIGDIETSTEFVDTSSYGPGNPYTSEIFRVRTGVMSTGYGIPVYGPNDDDWSSPANDNLWGGANDSAINAFGVLDSDKENRQGPCPEGYHVPSIGERNDLLTMWYNKEYKTGGAEILQYIKDTQKIATFRGTGGAGLGGAESKRLVMAFRDYFRLPPAGSREFLDFAPGVTYGNGGSFWTSSSPWLSGSRSIGSQVTDARIRLYPNNANSFDYNITREGYVGHGISGRKMIAQSVRCFKDVPECPSGSIWNQSELKCETITDCDMEHMAIQDLELFFIGGSGEISHYMMMDRNLGAFEVYNQKAESDQNARSLGCHFQWGNNYGFHLGTPTTRYGINPMSYGPGNYYSKNRFWCYIRSGSTYDGELLEDEPEDEGNSIYGSMYSPYNYHMWGGGYIDGSNNYIKGTTSGTDIDRQGPCPEGYHVPGGVEMKELVNNRNNASISQGAVGKNFASDLLMPYGRYIEVYCGEQNKLKKGGGIWLSDKVYYRKQGAQHGTYANHLMKFTDTSDIGFGNNGYAHGFPVRCVKNEMANTPQKVTIHVDGGTGAVIAIDWETEGSGKITALSSPTKNGINFLGWYSSLSFAPETKLNTGDYVSSGSHIYARWDGCNIADTAVQNLEVFFLLTPTRISHYMMMDRNLGATEAFNQDISSPNESSYGCYFQWGNNYPFNGGRNGSPSTTGTLTDTENYGPGRSKGYYYNSARYCVGGGGTGMYPYADRSGPVPLATWFWGGGWFDIYGDMYSGSIDGTDIDRQGPCPAGYHIPRGKEMENIMNDWKAISSYNQSDAESINLEKSKIMASDLLLPFAGWNGEGCENENHYLGKGTFGKYLISDYYRFNKNHLHIGHTSDPDGIFLKGNGPAYGFSMRCVKNNISDTPQKVTIDADGGTGAVIAIDWESAENGKIVTLGEPRKNGYDFGGWYTNQSFTTSVNVGDGISNGGSLYAKWIARDCDVENTTVQDLEVYFLSNTGNITHYTMMDRNLGAMEVYNQNPSLQNEESFGCYFQWGNNYGFNKGRRGSSYTTETLTDTKSYGPGSQSGYYYNSKRYCNLPGSGDNMYPKDGSGYPFATRLWGGGYVYSDGSYRNDGWGSRGIDGTDEDRQGPCPEGYHVPRGIEMGSIIQEWKDVADYPKTQSEYSSSIGLQKSKQLASDLMFPLAGGNQTYCSGTLYVNNNFGSYIIGDYYKRTNPITSTYMPTNHLHIGSSAAGNGIYFYLNGPAHGKSMRCVKNNISANPKITIHPNGGTGAVIVIDWENEGSGKIMTLGEPSKLGYSFEGWYSDESFTNRITTGDYISNSGSLYAKWNELIAIFMKGRDFRNELINLARVQNAYESGENIEGFKRVNIIPSGVTTGLVSDVSSGAPIWAWYYSGVIYYYTEANKIYLNEDSSDMFGDLTNLVSIDMEDWDTSNVINMKGIFSGCNSLTGLNLSNWDTSNVTNMSFMFSNCSNLTDLNLSGRNTSEVKNMRNMFDYCRSLTSLDVGNWDTSKVTNMTAMFRYCSSLTNLDVSRWNTSSVSNMAAMFNQCRSLTSIGVSEWDTSNVTNMQDLFNHCVSVTKLDLSKWNTSKVTTMFDMFTDCLELVDLDISNFNTSNVTNMGMMFQTCPKLESLDLSHFNTSKVTSMRHMFGGSSSLKQINLSNWDTSKVTDMRRMFGSCHSLTSLDLRHFDTSNVTGMDLMFSATFALTDLDLSSFDTSKVVTMSGMFSGCYNLKTIYASTGFVTDSVTDDTSSMFIDDNVLVGGFGTRYSSSHTDKEYARIDSESQSGYFTLLKISTLLPGINFKNTLTNLAGNETNITKIIQYTGNIIPSGVTTGLLSTNDSAYPVYAWYDNGTIYYYTNADIIYLNSDSSSMFYNMKGLTKLDLSNFNTSKVTDMSGMFANCSGLTNLNLSGRNTSKVTSMQKMFYNCQSLIELDVSNWDTSSVIDMESMFLDCISLENLDVSNWNTSNVTNMESMFQSCITLKTLDVSKRKTDNVTNMRFMFGGKFYNVMNLENLDVSNWNTSNVTNMEAMFQNCENLTGLDVSGWETDNLTTMNHMFFNCGKLTNLDVSKWNTSNVTDMSSVFYECVNLTGLDVSNWDTSKVTDMKFMFAAGSGVDMKFEYLDVSNWNTSNVTSMHCMFQSCGSLTKLDVSNWNTSNVTDMDHMFHGCENLTKLDVSNWDTSKVTNMNAMFLDCKRLTKLDVGNWDTSKVTDMSFMFYGCTNLVTIYANLGFVTNQVTGSVNMFAGDRKLVGGFGTTFNSSKINKEYARIDNESQSGYFTLLKDATLLPGPSFRGEIVSLAGNDTNIIKILHYTGNTIPSGVTTGLLSTNGSMYPVYAWYDSGIIYYYTEANRIYLNKNCERMFIGLKNLTEIDTSKWNTSNVTTTYFMFDGCSSLTGLDVSNWNTSKVTNMDFMFESCENLVDLDVSNWNMSRVTTAYGMFHGCSSLTGLDVSKWNVGNVYNMSSMFDGCKNLVDLDVSKWNMGGVWRTNGMFDGCSSLTGLDVSKWNTQKFFWTENMFRGCSKLTSLDVSNWNMSNLNDADGMFRGCSSLTGLDVSKWSTSGVTSMSYMFNGCMGLTWSGLDVSNWNTSSLRDMSYMFNGCTGLTGLSVDKRDTSKAEDMSYMFEGCTNLTNLNVSKWSTSGVKDMSYMFNGCSSLTGLDVSKWNTSNLMNANNMFKNCTNLTWSGLDVSNWNTSNITGMIGMFNGCVGLTGLSVDRRDTSKAENMSYMFSGCTNLTNLNVSQWSTSGVKNMSYMFNGCSSLTGLDVSNWNTNNLIKTNNMFENCSKLAGLNTTKWKLSNLQEASNMFKKCSNLEILDVINRNMSSIRHMGGMFAGCSNLKRLDINAWKVGLNPAGIGSYSMDGMFQGCKSLTGLDLSSWDVKSFSQNMASLFNGCTNLKEIDLSSWDTSSALYIDYMFKNCENLETIYVSTGFVTSKVGYSYSTDMFLNDTNLKGGNGTRYSSSHVDKTYARIDKPGTPGYFTLKQ